MTRIQFRRTDGILLLDKSTGMSSNAALQVARRLFRAEKGGHTGSLDPLATGLLPLCFGEATKIAGLLLGSAKAYDAEIVLGQTTDTDDSEGQVLLQRPVPAIGAEALQAALAPLTGNIRQRAPVYSALKQGGEPLYVKARRGDVIEAPEREVQVHAIDVLEQQPERLRLRVTCGSGTYIRSPPATGRGAGMWRTHQCAAPALGGAVPRTGDGHPGPAAGDGRGRRRGGHGCAAAAAGGRPG